MRALFVYRYLTLGGVEVVLSTRLAHLGKWGIEAHAWFLEDGPGRSLFAGCSQRAHVGSCEQLVELIDRHAFEVVSVIDTPEVIDGITTCARRPRLLAEVHTTYAESLRNLADLVAAVDAVLVPSPAQAQRIRSRLRPDAPLVVTANPLSSHFLEAPERQPPHRRPIIAWVGRLDEHKNWRGALEVARLVERAGVEAETWLVGAPVSRATAGELLVTARGAGVLGRLRWLRAVANAAMPALLDTVRESGGVLLTTSRAESFGLCVAEAMARACAIVAPDQPLYRGLGCEAPIGRFYRSRSLAEAAGAVHELLTDAVLRAGCGASGRRIALERLAPERCLPALVDVLQSERQARRGAA